MRPLVGTLVDCQVPCDRMLLVFHTHLKMVIENIGVFFRRSVYSSVGAFHLPVVSWFCFLTVHTQVF